MAGLGRTGLVQPGSLYTSKYRIRLPGAVSPDSVGDRLKAAFPSASWQIRDRDGGGAGGEPLLLADGAVPEPDRPRRPDHRRHRRQQRRLLLSAAQARRHRHAEGAGRDLGRHLRAIYLAQIGLVAGIAVLAGLVAGALLPPALIALAGDVLPVRPGFALHWTPLATSAAFGLLVAFMFVLPPLARARRFPVATLFRAGLERRPVDRPAQPGARRRRRGGGGGAGGRDVARSFVRRRGARRGRGGVPRPARASARRCVDGAPAAAVPPAPGPARRRRAPPARGADRGAW